MSLVLILRQLLGGLPKRGIFINGHYALWTEGVTYSRRITGYPGNNSISASSLILLWIHANKGPQVNETTIENVVEAYPRNGWSTCFRDTVVAEKKAKPYAMVSRIEGFEDMIMGNKLMNKYD